MLSGQRKKNLLTSWKEIASYLDCDERTCRTWEKKYGLPVRRLDRNSKVRVFAYKDELDTWLQNRAHKRKISIRFQVLQRKPYKEIFVLLLPLILILIAFLIYASIGNSNNPIPSDFEIENSNLVILDGEGNTCWMHYTKVENLIDANEYRDHFQYKRERKDGSLRQDLPFLIIKDIDSDEKAEVLFSIQTQNDYNEGILRCFNFQGKELWNFGVGREIKFGQNVYSNDFRIFGFDTHDLNEDGEDEIIIISPHIYDWPCQTVILDKDGKKIGEYWNSGYFKDFEVVDLDNDSHKELIFVGVNNEYKRGCLVVFKSENVNGCSPQEEEEYKSKKLKVGSEIFYILLPRTDVDFLETAQNSIISIQILKNNRISVITAFTNIIYEFNFDLELENIILSNKFKQLNKKAYIEGKITSELDEKDYKDKLAEALLYYDGKNWKYKPTMIYH